MHIQTTWKDGATRNTSSWILASVVIGLVVGVLTGGNLNLGSCNCEGCNTLQPVLAAASKSNPTTDIYKGLSSKEMNGNPPRPLVCTRLTEVETHERCEFATNLSCMQILGGVMPQECVIPGQCNKYSKPLTTVRIDACMRHMCSIAFGACAS